MSHINKLKLSLIPMLVAMTGYIPAMAQLAGGTYTIGGTTPNYPTLTAAIAALGSGISGPVTFNIRPGTYSTPISINAITGSSATNRITFQAESGKGTVTIDAAGTTTSNNFAVRLSNANYVTIKNITLNNSGATYGAGINIQGTSSYDSIVGCLVKGHSGTSTNENKSRIYAKNHTGTNIVLYQDSTVGGSYGIYWYGTSSSVLSNNITIAGNTTISPYLGCIYTYYVNGLKILNNQGHNITGVAAFNTYFTNYSYGRVEVVGNTADVTGTGTMYGLAMKYCMGDANNSAQRGLVKNNTITLTNTSSGSIYPLYNYESQYDSIVDNNLSAKGKSGAAYCYFSYSAPNVYAYGNTIYDSTGTGASYYYGAYSAPNSTIRKNKIRILGGSTFYEYGVYSSASSIVDSNDMYFSTSGTSAYYYTCGTSSSTGTVYSSPNSTFNANIIKRIVPSSTGYMYTGLFYSSDGCIGRANDIVNFKGGTSTSGYLYNNTSRSSDNTILENNIFLDSTNYYIMHYTNYSQTGSVFNNNIHRFYVRSGGYTYNYMQYYGKNTRYTNNKVNAMMGAGYYYGYFYETSSTAYGNNVLANNTINSFSPSGGRGIYSYYLNADTIYNNAITVNGSGTLYGWYNYYPYSGIISVYNNSFYVGGSGYGIYDYNYTVYSGSMRYNNNIVSCASGCTPYYAVNLNIPGSDYNNWYAPGNNSTLFDINGTTYNSITAWRAATGLDMNSLKYNPGFKDPANGDLHPDPAKPEAWSVNGRGIHIPSNYSDLDGNMRPTTTGAGVPDLGAYEFTPMASPPACTPNPAVPSPGTTQTFTFGQDTVLAIDWDATATVPGSITVKQFSGEMAPGITSFNPTYMYFHDSIGVAGAGGYKYTIRNYYKDPWIGTIASENSLRLAKKIAASSGTWNGYAAGANSTLRNYFSTTNLTDFGFYTAIDISNNAGVVEVASPVPSFCPGTYPTSIRVANYGNNPITGLQVCWSVNGAPVVCTTLTTTIPVYNGVPYSNSILVPIGNVTYGSGYVNIKAWTSSPNNLTDANVNDDTLHGMPHAALQGIYTVGGAAPDYVDVVSALNDLKKFGMCGNVTFKVRAGNYVGQLDLGGVTKANTADRLTITADDGVPASAVNINYAATSSSADNFVVRFNELHNVTLNKLSLNATGSSYGYVIRFNGTQNNNDSILHCNINGAVPSNSYNAGIYLPSGTSQPSNLVIIGNTISNVYYGMYLYSSTSLTPGLVVDSNEINSYYYGIYYINNFNGAKCRYNRITVTNIYSYGVMYFYGTGNTVAPEFIGNIVSGGSYYGAYFSSFTGTSNKRAKVINNVITYSGTGSGNYMMYSSSSSYADFYNNTIICAKTGSISYGAYLTSPSNTRIKNNTISMYNSATAALYLSGSAEIDYNNYYTAGTNLVSSSGTYANLPAWRSSATAVGMGNADRNSISYNPEVDINTGKPDVANPASWSLNGRGKQLIGNDRDKDGNIRPDILANGVPDIGAYEFEPTALPPMAIPSAAAAPGVTQHFTFGYDTIASITWNPALGITDTLEVRSYSGRQAPGFNTISPIKHMYYYTEVKPRGSATTFDYKVDAHYLPSWLGTMPAENRIKLAENVGGKWVAYNGINSATNANRDITSAPDLVSFGQFTGIDDSTIFSALVKPRGSSVVCNGSSVTLKATKDAGFAYQWNKNGISLPGETDDSLVVTSPGDYTVTILAGSSLGSSTSIKITVSTIAPPMAQISASGPLTFCPGSSLTLNSNTGPGLSYQWIVNGLDISGATSPSYKVTSDGSYVLRVSNIGCATLSNAAIVTPGPLSLDIGNDTAFCESRFNPFILDAGITGAKYMWSTGDTTRSIKIFAKGGGYWVKVDAGINCKSQDTIFLTVKPLPSINSINAQPLGSNTWSFSPAGAQNVAAVKWIFPDGTSDNNTTVQHTFPDGNVVVKLVTYNDCGSDTTSLIQWATNASNIINEGFEVLLYPNPSIEKATLSLNGDVKLTDISVYNSVGTEVYSKIMDPNAKQVVIDVTSFVPGNYIIKAVTTEGVISRKFNVIR